MTAESRSSAAPLPRSELGSRHLQSGAMAWQVTDDAGFWIKPLFEDAASGSRTLLMRMDPGAQVGARSHDELEEILVLSGEFSDHERTHKQGDYCVRAPGAVHTARSERGCTMLVIYRR
ncbi:MAG TPA: cupin domain-containing protein [Stellaceae bacterium]|nr:cupin domain-containing protein [Stellaceae bacterium]